MKRKRPIQFFMSLALRNISTPSRADSAAPALKDLSLELEPGSFNVLLGPTGSGKTELLRVMAGLDPVAGGNLIVDGRDVTGRSVRQRDVAFVYQEFVNYPGMSVYENIASPLRVRKVAANEIDARVREVARQLGISELLDRRPGEISGGQQQRVALGRALVRRTQLVLLDEPLVNLDYKLREKFRRDIRAIFSENEGVIVFATSDPAEAMILGGRMILLDRGRLLQSGPASDVYRRPETTRAAGMLSDPPMNLMPFRLNGDRARVAGADMDFPPPPSGAAGEGWIGLRPHQIRLSGHPGDREFTGTVRLTELSGSETFLHIATGSQTLIIQRQGTHSFASEASLRFFIHPRDLFYYNGEGRLLHAPEAEPGSAAPV